MEKNYIIEGKDNFFILNHKVLKNLKQDFRFIKKISSK